MCLKKPVLNIITKSIFVLLDQQQPGWKLADNDITPSSLQVCHLAKQFSSHLIVPTNPTKYPYITLFLTLSCICKSNTEHVNKDLFIAIYINLCKMPVPQPWLLQVGRLWLSLPDNTTLLHTSEQVERHETGNFGVSQPFSSQRFDLKSKIKMKIFFIDSTKLSDFSVYYNYFMPFKVIFFIEKTEG